MLKQLGVYIINPGEAVYSGNSHFNSQSIFDTLLRDSHVSRGCWSGCGLGYDPAFNSGESYGCGGGAGYGVFPSESVIFK